MSAFFTVILLPYNKNKETVFFVPPFFYLELVVFVFRSIIDGLLVLVEEKGEAS